ncbi:MAG: 30S ribosomal protein S20 [candidate division WOR-3 bacterium]
MAKRTRSGLKRSRQSARRRLRNRARKQALKNALKEFRAAPDRAAAEKLAVKLQSIIDRSCRHHVIHRNTARRLKSRLAREIAEKA